MLQFQKGSILASFLVFWVSFGCTANDYLPSLENQAIAQELYLNPEWNALLHIEEGQSKILDPRFILSSEDFSSKNELVETINFLFGIDNSPTNICKFPARAIWINQQLKRPPINFGLCNQFSKYLESAPVNSIAVVYSSENLTQPSSMMGHVFLKISGENQLGKQVAHGVSFFTEINGINVPKIIFDSMVIGKQGFFALSPYQDKLSFYLQEEQRNVWEYELDLDSDQKELIQAHIWELKQAKLDYFFQDYNCATLLKFLISVAEPSLLDSKDAWTTPVDLVKTVDRANIVKNVSVIPSSKWKMRMLSEALTPQINDDIKHSVLNGDLPTFTDDQSTQQQFLALELASNYSDFLFENDAIPFQQWNALNQKVTTSKSKSSKGYEIDLSNYKNPLKTPPDSQVYTGVVSEEGNTKLKFGFLPTSHRLEDDNRQFFSENELRLGDMSFVISEEDKIDIDEFQLYAVSSLIPRETFSGGVSGRFRLGIEGHYDQKLERKNVGNVSGALGLGYRLSVDAFIYTLIGGGYGFTQHESYFYTNPEVGLVVNEVFDMKTIASIQNVWNQLDSNTDYYSFKLTQSKYINEHYSLVLEFNHRQNESKSENKLEVLFKHFF